jgi:hypothetical protein
LKDSILFFLKFYIILFFNSQRKMNVALVAIIALFVIIFIKN